MVRLTSLTALTMEPPERRNDFEIPTSSRSGRFPSGAMGSRPVISIAPLFPLRLPAAAAMSAPVGRIEGRRHLRPAAIEHQAAARRKGASCDRRRQIGDIAVDRGKAAPGIARRLRGSEQADAVGMGGVLEYVAGLPPFDGAAGIHHVNPG